MNKYARPFSKDFRGPATFEKSPLALVVFQIRWDRLTGLSDDITDAASAISSEIRERFPYSEPTNEITFRIDQSGVGSEPGPKIFNWFNLDKSLSVTLAPTFLTIQTSLYSGLDVFMEVVAYVIKAALNNVDIPVISRAGFRYVNRTLGNANSSNFVVESLSAAQRLGLSDQVEIRHSISDLNLGLGENSLQTRIGLLPPGVTIDPSIPPLNEPTWIFDLDAFSEGKFYADIEGILSKARELSDLAYDFFTTFTTNEFKSAHGMKYV